MNEHDKRVASVAGFRRTLGAQGSELEICPPGCTELHDKGKRPGRDHWQPLSANGKPAPVCRLHKIVREKVAGRYVCRACAKP